LEAAAIPAADRRSLLARRSFREGGLVDQSDCVRHHNHRPDDPHYDDHCEKSELRDYARPLAFRVPTAHEAKGAQAHRSFGIKQQLTISTSAA
jgi:hypothetical protein